jgi:sirohydrochlorin cobaltochelatase
MAAGLILFAHGARDAAWADPFQRLLGLVREAAPGHDVSLAFLERMQPTLREAAASMVEAGARAIRIVPVFLGQGGHVRQDLPAMIESLRSAHPGVDIYCAAPVGEDDTVLRAIVGYCLRQL